MSENQNTQHQCWESKIFKIHTYCYTIGNISFSIEKLKKLSNVS